MIPASLTRIAALAGAGRSGARRCAILFALLPVAACIGERPTGDFGRPAPSVIHDIFAPKVGNALADGREEPVSTFKLTDKELELRDRSWTLVRPPHASDWLGAVVAEGQRTRVLPDMDSSLSTDRYANFLLGERYQSSETRYARVARDLDADRALLRPYCDLAYRIAEIDAERLRVVNASPTLDPELAANAQNRAAENRRIMGWTWRSVYYRERSYSAAIDRLEVETPSRQLADTRRELRRFRGAISACENGPSGAEGDGRYTEGRRSRIVTDWRPPEPAAPQK